MFKVTNDAALKALERLMRLPEKLPEIAKKVEAEALGMAVIAADANIYNTTPGAYERTFEYRNSLNASASVSRFKVTVSISSTADYAANIEFGRDQVSGAMLQQAALTGAMNDPLTLGRSGQSWWIAGPVLTSAQVFAARRMRELLAAEAGRR